MASRAKGKFSSRLMDMKFMKRAEEKKTLATATKRKRDDHDEAHWVAKPPLSGAEAKPRCAVVIEGDPPPGALVGRFSFRSFNASTQRLHEEAEERLAQLTSGGDGDGDERERGEQSVSDADMARSMSKRQRTDS